MNRASALVYAFRAEARTLSWFKKHVFGRCVYCHADRPDLPLSSIIVRH